MAGTFAVSLLAGSPAVLGMLQAALPVFVVIGPVPGIAGLFAMSGCMEAGITHGPALGRILSEYAVDGKTQWNVVFINVTPAVFKSA